MECSLFTDIERRSTELQPRYSENDTAFCDNWLFDTVNHIRILRLKFEKGRGRPYESQRINPKRKSPAPFNNHYSMTGMGTVPDSLFWESCLDEVLNYPFADGNVFEEQVPQTFST